MKINKLILTGLTIALFCGGCTKEEETTAGVYNQPFTLEVSDGGFLSAEGGKTRVAEAGYQTVFTDGDRVGMIVVDNNNNPITDNLPFTYNGTTWTTADGGTTVAHAANCRYLFYYPYSETMNGKKSLEEVKAAFVPKINQSDYADYAASDLMVGEGSFNTDQQVLKVALEHDMTLLVLDIQQKHIFPDGTTRIWTSGEFLHGGFTIGGKVYVPWQDSDRKMRLLLPPFAESSVQYYYSFRQQRKAGTAQLAASESGSYQRISHTYDYVLIVGDIYYGDGTILPWEAGYLESSPIGVVFKIGRDEDGNWEDDCDYKLKDGTTSMPTIRGYVLALYDANDDNNGSTFGWGVSKQT